MRYTGWRTPVDSTGRVSIPAKMRRSHKINPGDMMEIYFHGSAICFKKDDTIQTAMCILDDLEDIVRNEKVSASGKQEEFLKEIEAMRKMLRRTFK